MKTNTITNLCIAIIAIYLLAIPYAHASDMDKWGYWMNYYYMNKEANSTPDFLNTINESKILENSQNAAPPIAANLSQIFNKNQDKILTWLTPNFSSHVKETIAVALILAELQDKAPKSYKDKVQYISNKFDFKPIISIEPTTPRDLDMMWGAFFTSANPLFIEKIISVLDESYSPTGDKMNDTILRGAAFWSLGSNMQQHALVESIVKKVHSSADDNIKPALFKILEKFEEGTKNFRFDNYDGDFTARLTPADPDVIEELEKPSYQGINLKIKAKAKRGETITLHLAFSGMELSDDLVANVTYDLKILDPNEEIYFDNKNIEAYKGRTPLRFSIFTTNDILGIHFEDKDLLGTYKIYSTITDHISNKSLNLEERVELIE